MPKYEYKAISLDRSRWTKRPKLDYLDVINEEGEQGWRFVEFTPKYARPKGSKRAEMIFEREID